MNTPGKMRSHAGQLVLILMALGGVLDAGADIYTVRRQGNSIVPTRSTEVSMDAETVVVRPGEEWDYAVTATFVMRNQSQETVSCSVAFPVAGDRASYSTYLDVNREFKVRMKSMNEPDTSFAPVRAEVVSNRPEQTKPVADGKQPDLFYSENVVWAVTWAPAETKVIEISYSMGEPTILPHSNQIASGWRLVYVVRTGALWKGPIGTADITFQFRREKWDQDFVLKPQTISYPKQARWVNQTTVHWHFEDWDPIEDIWAQCLRWEGFAGIENGNYFVRLPEPYRGNLAEYDDALIERLAEEELRFAAEHFPAEVKSLDRAPLKREIADWLYHEILARHGDPFIVGKRQEGEPKPADAITYDRDQNYLSKWSTKFAGYGYHGGWYKPDRKHPVRLEDLSALERRNLDFLGRYLKQLSR